MAHENGLYIGTWASNVDFAVTSVEFDYYLGFGNDITENISYTSAQSVPFPGESALNGSLQGSLSAYASRRAAYSDSFVDDTLYSYVSYGCALPYDVGLALQYGEYNFKDATFGNDDSTTTGPSA